MCDSPQLVPTLQELETSDSSLIGKGTFGIVKVAKSRKTNKKYALKIVDTQKLQKDDIFCVEREIAIHKKMNHPNIIKFYGHYSESKEITMILEYAANGNLFGYIRKKKRLSEMEAFRLFYQTAQALRYLHKNDILHRDIKPENLLLDEKNNIKLCDFGWSTQGISLKRNTFCGTYEYMSPEVVFKKPYDENIDVWALGILLYEMVHGRSPYKAKNIKEITNKMINENNIAFSHDISPDLADLITNILKLNPLERLNLNQVLEHPWVKRMYCFVDYKEIFEEKEEKILTRGTSVSFKSEKNSEIMEKRIIHKAKTFEKDIEGLTFMKMREKAKDRRNNRIFESFTNSDCPRVLMDMENLLQNLEISTQCKKKKGIFLL